MSIAARFHIKRGDFSLDVDFETPARGVTALFGPSGCGKTTLLRAIAGLQRGRDGYLRVGNQVWQDGGRFLAPHKRPIGYVFQEPSLFAHLSVRGNLEYGHCRLRAGERRVSVERAVQLLEIGPLLGRRPHELSGGEQQRVAIARALAVSPAMLLMDEPLAALDRTRKHEIMPCLEAIHRELDIPVLYVSHARDEVARLADYLVLLEAGSVLAVGPVGELFSRLDLTLSHDPDAGTVISALVAGHDAAFDLTYLDFPGGRFAVPRNRFPSGSAVRLQVAASDVSVTLQRQTGTSILNVFPASVEAIAPDGKAQVMVRLLTGGVPLLARITRKSAAQLELQVGKRVYAQVKSAALVS